MKRSLTIYCPPPYENESLSSFVGRAAQVYRMGGEPFFISLGVNSIKESRASYDIDYAPSPQLVEILSDCVPGWKGYDVERGSFRGWRLTPGNRTSYCQDCFEEDLRAGRTPYFRLDWGAAAVTCCWIHRTPLLTWQDVSPHGIRRIPYAWLEARRPVRMPEWYEQDAKLRREWDSAAGDVVRECLVPFERLQHAIEKPFLSPEPAHPSYDSLRQYVDQSVAQSIKLLFALRQAGRTLNAREHLLYPWVEPRVDYAYSANQPSTVSAMRRAGSVAWRRAYLQSAAWGLPSLDDSTIPRPPAVAVAFKDGGPKRRSTRKPRSRIDEARIPDA
jgi:hypothetical protein